MLEQGHPAIPAIIDRRAELRSTSLIELGRGDEKDLLNLATIKLSVLVPSTIQLPGSLRTLPRSWVFARAPVHDTRSQARHRTLYVRIHTYTYKYIHIHGIYVHIHAIRTFLYLAIFFVRYTNKTLYFVLT